MYFLVSCINFAVILLHAGRHMTNEVARFPSAHVKRFVSAGIKYGVIAVLYKKKLHTWHRLLRRLCMPSARCCAQKRGASPS